MIDGKFWSVGVPLELTEPSVVDRHERDPGLNQPTGQQAGLAEVVPAVSLPHLGRLVADPERGLSLGRGEQVVGPVGELVAAGDDRGRGDILAEPVEPLDHPASAVEPVEREGVGRGEVANPEALEVGVAAAAERVIRRGQVAARREDRRVGHRHVGGHRPALLFEGLRDHGAEAGIDQRRAGPIAGQQVVGGAIVLGLGRGHRPDQGHAIHHLGQVREHLADPQAGHGRVDRLELPFDVNRGVGLGVEGVDVRRPAGHPDQDAMLDLGRLDPPAPARDGLQPEQVIEPQAEGGQHPGARSKERRLGPRQARDGSLREVATASLLETRSVESRISG